MQLIEYVDQYDQAPMDIEEFAEGAATVTNCAALSTAAEEYLAAKQAFKDALEQHDITIG